MTIRDNLIRVLRFFGGFLAALAIAVSPFVIHNAPHNDVWFDSVLTFVSAFAVAGLVAGLAFGFIAAPATIVAYFISIAWLERAHFIGGGGDGDMFYLVAMFATAV